MIIISMSFVLLLSLFQVQQTHASNTCPTSKVTIRKSANSDDLMERDVKNSGPFSPLSKNSGTKNPVTRMHESDTRVRSGIGGFAYPCVSFRRLMIQLAAGHSIKLRFFRLSYAWRATFPLLFLPPDPFLFIR